MIPMGLTAAVVLLPGGPGLIPGLKIAALWLVVSYGGVTLLAAALAWRRGWLNRGMYKGIVMFGFFMASWLPLQVVCLFHRTTSWREIAHGCRMAVGKAA